MGDMTCHRRGRLGHSLRVGRLPVRGTPPGHVHDTPQPCKLSARQVIDRGSVFGNTEPPKLTPRGQEWGSRGTGISWSNSEPGERGGRPWHSSPTPPPAAPGRVPALRGRSWTQPPDAHPISSQHRHPRPGLPTPPNPTHTCRHAHTRSQHFIHTHLLHAHTHTYTHTYPMHAHPLYTHAHTPPVHRTHTDPSYTYTHIPYTYTPVHTHPHLLHTHMHTSCTHTSIQHTYTSYIHIPTHPLMHM